METTAKIHNIFDAFFYPRFLETFTLMKLKRPGITTLITVDHSVHNEFFWELNSFLIEKLPHYKLPIIPLPVGSTNEEFDTLLQKMRGGTMLMDKATFLTMTFKSNNPDYFYSDRILIHSNGEFSYYAGRKF